MEPFVSLQFVTAKAFQTSRHEGRFFTSGCSHTSGERWVVDESFPALWEPRLLRWTFTRQLDHTPPVSLHQLDVRALAEIPINPIQTRTPDPCERTWADSKGHDLVDLIVSFLIGCGQRCHHLTKVSVHAIWPESSKYLSKLGNVEQQPQTISMDSNAHGVQASNLLARRRCSMHDVSDAWEVANQLSSSLFCELRDIP